MKKIFLFIILSTINITIAQKELWGYRSTNNNSVPVPPEFNPGQIIKTSLIGNNNTLEIVHDFDPSGLLGVNPKGKLFMASNGKLYGVGGLNFTENENSVPSGFIFEYNLVLNKYRIVANSISYSFLKSPKDGLIEPTQGFLVGLSNDGASVFKYNFLNEVVTLIGTIPEFQDAQYLRKPNFVGTLLKASDGNLYGATNLAPVLGSTRFGGIYKINLNDNTISLLHAFTTDPNAIDVIAPIGSLVEGMPGKLYGTAEGGPPPYVNGVNPFGSGTIYEYDIATQGLTQKYAFNNLTEGKNPSPLIKASNNKLYGVLFCSTIFSEFNADGAIYEYDLITNTFSMLHVINYSVDENIYNLFGIACKGSDGNFYGTSRSGVFSYNPITNIVKKKIAILSNNLSIQDMIEICRKPSYQEFLPNTYATAAGSAFTYNVQNTNATTYVWKKGTTILPTQTTGILNLPSVTTNDTGVYTCTMTNECGTTVTANLNINVTNLAVETVDDYKSQISLYPNPTKGILNLKFPENRGLKGYNYKITNLLGQIMEEKDISTSTKNELSINTTSYAHGVYQITLVTDKGNWNGKFVKE